MGEDALERIPHQLDELGLINLSLIIYSIRTSHMRDALLISSHAQSKLWPLLISLLIVSKMPRHVACLDLRKMLGRIRHEEHRVYRALCHLAVADEITAGKTP